MIRHFFYFIIDQILLRDIEILTKHLFQLLKFLEYQQNAFIINNDDIIAFQSQGQTQMASLIIKSTRRIIANFSFQKQHPYILGGLPSSKIWASQKTQQFIHTIASRDLNQTFVQMYKRFLQALEQKDMQYLQRKVENNLLNNIINSKEDLVLINKEAPVQIMFQNSFIVANIGFNRGQHQQQMCLDKRSENLQMFEGYKKDMILSQNIVTILFGVKAYFKTSMKLVKANKKASLDKRQQTHLVQFQLESQRNKTKIFLRNIISKLTNFRNKKQQKLNMQRYIIGASIISDWKIGDFDRNLNGNLPKINTNPQFKKNIRNLQKHNQEES